jgi:UMF1 family MFS transporter
MTERADAGLSGETGSDGKRRGGSMDARERRREIFGFMMFDFANSSYTTVIITAIFNAYFVNAVVARGNRGELLWAVTLSISYFFIILFGPVLGALADYTGRKKRFLFASYLMCVVFTGLLFFIRPGDVLPAMLLVILSNVGYSASENFVSSFLPEIAGSEDMGRISGYAWSFGYVGGLLSLGACLALLTFYEPAATVHGFLAVRLSSLVTCIFFAAGAIPTFLWLKERAVKKALPEGESAFSIAFGRLLKTFRNMKRFRELMLFLVAFVFFYSGIAVVISFASVYAQKELGFSAGETVLLIIVVNVTAAAGAFAFGFLEDRLGSKRTILITLLLWMSTVLSAYFVRSRTGFWAIANFAGLAMGASQSSARALVGLFSPPSKSAEFFGFWGFSGKFSAIIGILSFGLLSYLFSSNRLAILSTIFYFFLGTVILLRVNEEKGRRAAVNYVDEA